MRSTLALLVPLLLVLGAIAWGAALVVEHTGRGWFDRDTRLRAQLAVSGAREAIEGPARTGERAKVQRVLSQLAHDERVLGAAMCDPALTAIAQTSAVPGGLRLSGGPRPGTGHGAAGVTWAFDSPYLGGRVHVTAVPIADEEGPLGFVVMAHDMSWVERREAQIRQFLAIAFGIVAIAAAVATTLAARFSWHRWTDEVRKLLSVPLLFRGRDDEARPSRPPRVPAAALRRAGPGGGARGGAGRGARRGLVAGAAARRAGPSLPGSDVLVVANREPYIHDRGTTAPSACSTRPAASSRRSSRWCRPAPAPGSPTAAGRPTATWWTARRACASRRRALPTPSGASG